MGGGKPKQFLELFGRPILAHTLRVLSRIEFISGILLIVPPNFMSAARQIVSEWVEGDNDPAQGAASISIVAGGAERQNSVYNGLMQLPSDCGWVLVHDGVRPFASPGLIKAVWEGAHETGASIAAVAATDTVKRGRGGRVEETIPRDEIWLVQTPQVFKKDTILAAYDKAFASGWCGTDDASFVERIGVPVSIVEGEKTNIKVTTPADMVWGEWFLARGAGKDAG